MKKRAVGLLFATIILLFSPFAALGAVRAEAVVYDVPAVIEGIIAQKKASLGKPVEEKLFYGDYLATAGQSDCDWYAFGIGRYGYDEDYAAYLSMAAKNVEKRYMQEGKLHFAKATEWHRIILAVAACGGAPSSFSSFEGQPINLVADGTYNRAQTASPGRQGINGWIWGLIALDCKKYAVPEGAANDRGDFITQILKCRLADGGFAMSGEISDPDVTAMAIQALAPYYNERKVYNYTSSKLKDENGVYLAQKCTVRQAVDEALGFLSSAQLDGGDYASWGTPNAESCCQVICALTALGIDPEKDERFIKDGKSAVDGLMKYRLNNGGFVHSFTYDAQIPDALPDTANSMAGQQALYALTALWRFNNGMRSLYDMRPEFTAEEQRQITSARAKISLLGDGAQESEIRAAATAYALVEQTNRQYIYNYPLLERAATAAGLEDILPEDEQNFSGDDSDVEVTVYEFTATEKAAADNLPPASELNSGYISQLTTLKFLIDNCDDFEGKGQYKIKIDKAYNAVTEILREIEDINAEIADKLYPFDSVGLGDKKTVDAIYARYMALSDYDKTKILYFEDLQKCKTKTDNLQTALIISLGCGGAATLAVIFIIADVRRRRRKKKAALMPESEE